MLRQLCTLVLLGALMQGLYACDMMHDDDALYNQALERNSTLSTLVDGGTYNGSDARRQLQATTKTYNIKPGDTINSIAGNFGITKASLRLANPEELASRTDTQRLRQLVGTLITIPIPNTAESGLGPLNCKNNEVMVSCSTDSTCQSLNVPEFGCIPESLCITLFQRCLAENPGCPSCCISCKGPNPESGNNKPVGYFLLTFADGSAHCDPWGWWRW